LEYNEEIIIKAKSNYFNKGIIDTSVVRKEIMFSWIRTKMPTCKEMSNFYSTTKALHNLLKLVEATYNIPFIIFTESGEILHSMKMVMEIESVSESIIGTTAFGISLFNKDEYVVKYHEHTNENFVNYLTATKKIILDNQIVYLGILIDNSQEYILNKFKSDSSFEKLITETEESLEEVEKNHIIKIFTVYEKNIDQCVKVLKISRATLYRKLKKYGIK
jgi:transcriptional regulator with PAS, ATPase and Fis domain